MRGSRRKHTPTERKSRWSWFPKHTERIPDPGLGSDCSLCPTRSSFCLRAPVASASFSPGFQCHLLHRPALNPKEPPGDFRFRSVRCISLAGTCVASSDLGRPAAALRRLWPLAPRLTRARGRDPASPLLPRGPRQRFLLSEQGASWSRFI